MVAVEKNELQTFQCLEELMQYCRRERPIWGTSWEDVELLLVPLNITNIYWVAMFIDIPSGYIYLFDFDLTATESEKMKTIVGKDEDHRRTLCVFGPKDSQEQWHV